MCRHSGTCSLALVPHQASHRPPASQLGGAPVPSAKPRPKSIPHISSGSPAQPHSQPTLPPPAPRLAPAQPSTALKPPQARIPRAPSSQAASEARREQMQAQLLVLVNLVGEHCQLFAILSASGHAQHHLRQLLAPFAASTLYRYISNCMAFAHFVQAEHAPMQQLPVSLVVDFLYACSSSAEQDRAVHRTSASSAVKSVRWLAKHIQWAALQARILLQANCLFRQTRGNAHPSSARCSMGAHSVRTSRTLDDQVSFGRRTAVHPFQHQDWGRTARSLAHAPA